MSNQKQIGLALLQYTQDYDEKFPAGLLTGWKGIGWAGQINPYIKSPQSFSCPNDRGGAATANGARPLSYALNGWVAGLNQAAFEETAKTIMVTEIAIGANIVLSQDAEIGDYKSAIDVGDNLVWADGNLGQNCCATSFNGISTGQRTGPFLDNPGGTNAVATNVPRHFDGANYLMLDGHAKWFKGTSVTAFRANADKSAVSMYRP